MIRYILIYLCVFVISCSNKKISNCEDVESSELIKYSSENVNTFYFDYLEPHELNLVNFPTEILFNSKDTVNFSIRNDFSILIGDLNDFENTKNYETKGENDITIIDSGDITSSFSINYKWYVLDEFNGTNHQYFFICDSQYKNHDLKLVFQNELKNDFFDNLCNFKFIVMNTEIIIH